MEIKHSIIIPESVIPSPSEREISAAQILIGFFSSNIKFVPRNTQKTADFIINGQYWELKCLNGNGKRTVQHALQRASRQARNIIVDARFSKMHIAKIKSQIKYEMCHMPNIKRVVLIEKNKKVIEIFR